MKKVVSDFMILLATIDPVGTLTLFVAMTGKLNTAERRRVAVRAVAYAAAIILAFIIGGQLLLAGLGVRLEAFQIAGGIVFFIFGVRMVFGEVSAGAATESEPGRDLAVFPLAVPSLASPGSILAAVMLTDNRQFGIGVQAVTAAILVGVLLLTLGLLMVASRVHRLIGNAGASLLERVLGLILAAIAVEMLIEASIALWPATPGT